MSGRLDDEKLDTLRSWGAGLVADERDELRAAGRAILILVEEIERLQVDLWHGRGEAPRGARGPSVERDQETEDDATAPGDGPSEALESTLRKRIGRFLGARQPEGR